MPEPPFLYFVCTCALPESNLCTCTCVTCTGYKPHQLLEGIRWRWYWGRGNVSHHRGRQALRGFFVSCVGSSRVFWIHYPQDSSSRSQRGLWGYRVPAVAGDSGVAICVCRCLMRMFCSVGVCSAYNFPLLCYWLRFELRLLCLVSFGGTLFGVVCIGLHLWLCVILWIRLCICTL